MNGVFMGYTGEVRKIIGLLRNQPVPGEHHDVAEVLVLVAEVGVIFEAFAFVYGLAFIEEDSQLLHPKVPRRGWVIFPPNPLP